MKYYIFRVKDSTGDEYYVLNNQYIGYIGFDSHTLRSILEYRAKNYKKYVLYAESKMISGKVDEKLHKLNCSSTRFTAEEINSLIKETGVFQLSKDKTTYSIYYPDKNSSLCYLKEINGTKTIQ